MDDKEKEFDELDNNDVEIEAPKSEDLEASTEENKVDEKVEEKKDWEFDAKAPMLDEEISVGDDFQIDFKKTYEEPVKEEEKHSDEIVINKTKLKKTMLLILTVIIAIGVIVGGVLFFVQPNSSEIMNPGNVALKIGNTNVSVGEYNYYYSTVLAQYENAAQYGQIDLDVTKDFSEQMTVDEDGNEISWLDKIEHDTVEQIKTLITYYQEGKKAGIDLTQDEELQIEEQITAIESGAAEKNLSANKFIQKQYGDFCGERTIKKFFEQLIIATAYLNQQQITERVTDEEINEFYEANKQDYLSTKFGCIEIYYDQANNENAKTIEEFAKENASKIKDIKSLQDMIPTACKDIIEQYAATGRYGSEEDVIKALQDSSVMTKSYKEIENQFDEKIATWLFDANTPLNTTNYFLDKENGYIYIFLKMEQPTNNEEKLYSVRHILIQPKATSKDAKVGEDTTEENKEDSKEETTVANSQQAPNEQPKVTDEDWKDAEKEANDILNEFNSGDKSELSFALLAEEKSEDIESTSKGSSGLYGGLYENVALKQMVPEFEEWAVDPSRKFGDVGIVKSTYGYHIMYFVSNQPKYLIDASLDLRIEKQKEFVNSYKVKEKIGMKRVIVAKPQVQETNNALQSVN